MKQTRTGFLVLAAVLGMAAAAQLPAAAAQEGPSPTQLSITMVCTLPLDAINAAGRDMSSCELSVAPVQITMATAAASIPEGSLLPGCAPTDSCFVPYEIAVEPGTAVTWTNDDSVLHTVTGKGTHPDGDFDGLLVPGEVFTFTFRTEGTYRYGCTLHPWAAGTVTVGDAPAAAPGPVYSAERDEATKNLVDAMVALYEERGEESFDMMGTLAPHHEGLLPGAVVGAESRVIVATTGDSRIIGLPVFAPTSVPLDAFLDILGEERDGVWLSYPLVGPQGDEVFQRGWFVLRDGYIFIGSYVPAAPGPAPATASPAQLGTAARDAVERMIAQYTAEGTESFAALPALFGDFGQLRAGLVMDRDDTTIAAHSGGPNFVGHSTRAWFDHSSPVPLETLLQRLETEGDGIRYGFPSFGVQGDPDKYDHAWIRLHDGYVFAAMYSLEGDGGVQSLVRDIIEHYDRDWQGTLEAINAAEAADAVILFAVDADTSMTAAHGAGLAPVGEAASFLADASIPLDALLGLGEGEGVWTWYTMVHPQTGMDTPVRAWVVSHGGYLFGGAHFDS